MLLYAVSRDSGQLLLLLSALSSPLVTPFPSATWAAQPPSLTITQNSKLQNLLKAALTYRHADLWPCRSFCLLFLQATLHLDYLVTLTLGFILTNNPVTQGALWPSLYMETEAQRCYLIFAKPQGGDKLKPDLSPSLCDFRTWAPRHHCRLSQKLVHDERLWGRRQERGHSGKYEWETEEQDEVHSQEIARDGEQGCPGPVIWLWDLKMLKRLSLGKALGGLIARSSS